jgi:FAD/FMN-containing dehydrogenase/Fe-S oxidoreductase
MTAIVETSVTTDAVEQALRGRLAGDLLTDRFSQAAYSTAACIYKIRPLAIVLPKSADDVAVTVKAAAELGVSIIPRGAGSGLCGQALGTGIVLDFTKYMTRLLEVDVANRLMRVQPGAVTGQVNEALAKFGLMLGPDPSSEPFCTIGGNLGNNSSGSRGISYGSMKDYVAWLDVVLADGSRVRLEAIEDSDEEVTSLESRGDLRGRIVAGTRRIVRDNAELIRRFTPHNSKNSAGYNLFEVQCAGRLDLTRLVVGAEGTLAVIVEAGIRLVPKPKDRASVMLWFEDLEKAGAAVAPILALKPSACEIMERHFLDIVRADGTVPKEYLPQRADTVLLVEFLSDNRKTNEASIAAVRRRILDELRLGFGAMDAYDPKEQERLWIVRKRAVQILQRLPGPTRITPFIEDVVVPPENLVTYIQGLREIFGRFKVEAAVYGHAGDSNLHARPLLDLRKAEDLARMKGIAEAVARLTVDLGGTISCEHGDGLTRSGYLELQFGELYGVMAEIKQLWDPKGTLNPGKVITDEREVHTDHLRMGPEFRMSEAGGRIDREPWPTEIWRCHGCGTCRATCPAFKATGDEVATPRAKANLLRAALDGGLAASDIADRKMQGIVDLCYNCKTCVVECPSKVNVAGLVLRHKEVLAARGRLGFMDKLILNVRPMGRMGSMLAPVANAMIRWRPVRSMMGVAGINPNAPMPTFARDRLKEGEKTAVEQPSCRVAYFAGCFELFNESDIGRASLRVLQSLGCEVFIPGQRCCGIPKISAGDVKGALADMRFNLAVLAPLVEAGYTVAAGCPSCVLTLAEDYPELAQGDDRARLVSKHTKDVQSLVMELAENWKGQATPSFATKKLAYHAPCHLRAAGRGTEPRQMLERLVGAKFVMSNLSCCGMGGTFGLKTRNAEVSEKIGREVFERIRASGAEAVVTSCGMCRTQLAAGTGLPVYHPMELLAEALAPAVAAGKDA